MSAALKLLWSEGLFLRPQHFQQQDRYHENRLHQAMQAAHPYLWGVRTLEWDMSALRNMLLRLDAFSAIFHDGELVDAPGCDPLPPALDLDAVPASVQAFTCYASLALLAPDASNYAPSAMHAPGARYVRHDRDTPDIYSDAISAELCYLRPAVRLVTDLEPRSASDCIPVARLRRVVSGAFEHDPSFIPPSLSLAAAPRLTALLEQLMDALQAKVNALHGHMREPSRNVIEFRSGDVSSFWLLHTASTSAATLMHYLRHPQLHPERLFEAMLGLAGALMTYSKSYQLNQLPVYEHASPSAPFQRLDGIIRDLLDTVISARYFAIALAEEKPCYHLGKLDSGKVGAGTTLYLAIAAAMPALELVDVVPLRVKVGAPDDVEKCVLAAMPGVKLLHAPQVPAAIPVRPDTYYFALENRGVLYEQMLKAQSISIYVPAGIRDLRLELIAVTA
ncbi:MAG TPA: type VI secretion system baseplate subunit TssK [Pseudoduganella sp.]